MGIKGRSLVARKRGFFAELQYQSQQAEKRRRQQAAAAYRAQMATHFVRLAHVQLRRAG